MFSKFELIGGAISICLIAMALYALQLRNVGSLNEQVASAIESEPGLQVVTQSAATAGVNNSAENEVTTNDMKITDIKIGNGAAAQDGDTVAVHYVGRLQDGTEFDNSHKRSAPIEFKLGAGQVISGWEEGIAGMQVGGERTLVIPPDKAYGPSGIPGVIPPNATLVFAVELVSINE